jgi:DNA-directed RNA polymerase II subunit RPB2
MSATMMYSGVTGEMLGRPVFMGVCAYEKLKHFSGEKAFGKSTGPRQVLTRQPVAGRSKDGGLRFGEMECDCIVAHGGTATLKDALHERSDSFHTVVCKGCGLLAIPAKPDRDRLESVGGREHYCKNCDSGAMVVDIVIPYGSKLLFQELMAMGIAPRLETTASE